eukprot:TRINITY_DN13312_c0_g1_i1.p1 TRINITY_DN13312_c0_g1~~TRINITY_DN13312_c0_g1_i1.p1  ORF type:complete len:311 (+),score=38.33 TRINITY_DN13312_c0_g1_i1:58-990(+)
MVYAHTVVVKNTFINVLDIDEGGTLARQMSEPVPQVSFVDSLPDTEARGSKKDEPFGVPSGLESRRTSAGQEMAGHSERISFGPEEWSSVNTPILNACESPSPRESCSAYASFESFDGLLQQPSGSAQTGIPSEWEGKTSVMIRNISYKCTRTMFCDELRKAGFEGLFDYVYVPINAGRGTSKGYAFANFLDASTAYSFKEHFDGRKLDIPGGVKRLEVIPANLQGFTQNASHYLTKQSEDDVPLPRLSLRRHMPFDGDQSGKSDASSTLAVATIAAPCPRKQVKLVSCRQCNGKVLPTSRFCQWCGVGL